jgi:hypothetical protein
MFRFRKVIRRFFPSSPFILSSVRKFIYRLSHLAANRVQAPLRRIVRRELEVFSFFRNTERPAAFAIVDTLECGHESVCYSASFLDLANAYTDHRGITARRHRCQPCLVISSARKPVASIGLQRAAGVA